MTSVRDSTPVATHASYRSEMSDESEQHRYSFVDVYSGLTLLRDAVRSTSRRSCWSAGI